MGTTPGGANNHAKSGKVGPDGRPAERILKVLLIFNSMNAHCFIFETTPKTNGPFRGRCFDASAIGTDQNFCE
jgi:hypothetical protein